MYWYVLVCTQFYTSTLAYLVAPHRALLYSKNKYSKNKNSCFPAGCADAAAEDGRRGSNVYEVNTWLWQFGPGKPRLGGLTI